MLENLNDALIDLVKCCGGSKVVGALMRPELSADDAGKWLRDCLNVDRREKLAPEQFVWLLRLGRDANCHAAAIFVGAEVGYSVTPAERETDAARLLRMMEEHNAQAAEIARLMTGMQAGKGARR